MSETKIFFMYYGLNTKVHQVFGVNIGYKKEKLGEIIYSCN